MIRQQRILLVVSGTRKAKNDDDALLFFDAQITRTWARMCPYGASVKLAGLVHGGAPGIDTIAQAWADHQELPVVAIDAKWEAQGNAAGPIRNKLMLTKAAKWLETNLGTQKDASIAPMVLCLAFPGPESKGTIDFIKQAIPFCSADFRIHLEPWVGRT